MEEIIKGLFNTYLRELKIAKQPEFSVFSGKALKKEKELRNIMTEEQTTLFEELFEITSQIHFLEVKDAFINGCKLGANASKEFTI